MLGHASAAMTLDVYAGPFPDDLASVAEALDGLMTQAQLQLPSLESHPSTGVGVTLVRVVSGGQQAHTTPDLRKL